MYYLTFCIEKTERSYFSYFTEYFGFIHFDNMLRNWLVYFQKISSDCLNQLTSNSNASYRRSISLKDAIVAKFSHISPLCIL